MALDFTGIYNEEFYSSHYLEAVLEGDLKSVYKQWAEREKDGQGAQPHKRLAGLSNAYFEAQGRAESEPDAQDRWRPARGFHVELLERLGYQYSPSLELLDGDEQLPVLVALERDGRPYLWIVDAPFAPSKDDDSLDQRPLQCQVPSDDQANLPTATWRELLDNRIFRLDEAPRWVLFLAGSECYLAERHKWPQGKYLRFDWGELLGRSETNALKAAAGLLHKDVIAPDAGLCLHDTLDENSHKHAHAVSTDLRYGVRRAVEILANEAVYYRRHVQKREVFQSESQELADKLKSDGLILLYRLLFLFYVEARSEELGVVPMKSEAYRSGYSLESLRDLELVQLSTEHARAGYYIHDSLAILFELLNDGFATQKEDVGKLGFVAPFQAAMRMEGLQSPLFDDDRLLVMKGIRFRNEPMQEILQLLSLSAVKKRGRGRISYASLGINQLGSVYEGLLSYSGFFAGEDLHEVAAEKDAKKISGKSEAEREVASHKGKVKTHFVAASKIGDYKEGEIVRDENERKVVHKKGAFIFRLAGRNREKSASYYTPEVLTRCLVKYALKELLWEEGEEGAKPTRKKTADKILSLTICEPAMGSSAFLIEAVDQLADAYLQAKQEEVKASGGETIPPEDYQREKRRVMARLATNNCYGVDLNPTSVELAKVSLWLATLHEGGKCPWFGLRLAAGNSLVGARREVFRTTDVTRKGTKDAPSWLGLVPEAVPLHHREHAPPPNGADWASWMAPPRPKGTIYHFLLPAEGMAAFDKDKVIKQLAPGSVKRIKEWRKEFCKPFNKKDAERLEQISDAVDRLLAQVVRERVLATQETSDRIPVWGEAGYEEGIAHQADLLVRDQEEVAASLEDGSSAYRRLKLVMDAWCALWFWPIEETALLPARDNWLALLELVLLEVSPLELVDLDVQAPDTMGSTRSSAELPQPPSDAKAITRDRLRALSGEFRDHRAAHLEMCGLVDVNASVEREPLLRVVQSVADRLQFHHWHLRFAEVFGARGGFDLVVGNPPWVLLSFDSIGFMADYDPRVAVRRMSAPSLSEARAALLEDPSTLRDFIEELETALGGQHFLGSQQNFPALIGMKTNLYKCFVAKSWELGCLDGVAAFVHADGLFDDPRGSPLRRALYPRLRAHFHFVNELRLFSEVHHLKKYSLNIYASTAGDEVRATCIFGLFHPLTIDGCLSHDGFGNVPGVKDSEGDWDLSPHSERVIELDRDALTLFADLYDEPGTPYLHARLPVVHSLGALRVLSRISSQPVKLRDRREDFFSTNMFDETQSQRDGAIVRHDGEVESLDRLVYQGPHFYVGTPFNKSPNPGCSHQQDYKAIDLDHATGDFVPRTNYAPGTAERFWAGIPQWRSRPVTSDYRLINREMASPTGERALITCVIPPGPTHVHAVIGTSFSDSELLLDFAALTCSIPFDFFVRSAGKGHVDHNALRALPLPDCADVRSLLHLRVMRLNCLSGAYSSLWDAAYAPQWSDDSFTVASPALTNLGNVPPRWRASVGLRDDSSRRRALVEIDVLAAMVLGLSLDDLCSVYTSQFPILVHYEHQRQYDRAGRVVPTSKTVEGNPAVSLIELAAALREQAGFDIHAEYHPDEPSTQELRRQKTRLGKKEAGVLGVSERCTMADLLSETEVRWSDEDHSEGRPVRLVGLRYTDPGLEPRMERVYPTPWTRCDREADYRQAWAEFERRLGKKMPEGSSQ